MLPFKYISEMGLIIPVKITLGGIDVGHLYSGRS